MVIKTQFITDEYGKKLGVVLPIRIYKKILDELEEFEDIKLFDRAKKEDDSNRILLDDYIKKRSLWLMS